MTTVRSDLVTSTSPSQELVTDFQTYTSFFLYSSKYFKLSVVRQSMLRAYIALQHWVFKILAVSNAFRLFLRNLVIIEVVLRPLFISLRNKPKITNADDHRRETKTVQMLPDNCTWWPCHPRRFLI